MRNQFHFEAQGLTRDLCSSRGQFTEKCHYYYTLVWDPNVALKPPVCGRQLSVNPIILDTSTAKLHTKVLTRN